jgi:hypothetical protein
MVSWANTLVLVMALVRNVRKDPRYCRDRLGLKVDLEIRVNVDRQRLEDNFSSNMRIPTSNYYRSK